MRSVNGINQDVLYHFATFFAYILIILHFGIFYDIMNTNMIPNSIGFVIDVFIDVGVKQNKALLRFKY